jgi:hypothetical protein
VYGPDWHSGIRIRAVILPLVRLVLGGMFSRVVRAIQRRILGTRAVALRETPSP